MSTNRPHAQYYLPPTSALSQTRLEGLIMWLPSRESLPTRAGLPPKLPAGCYGHPVVVLSPEVSHRGEVVILILTSFGDRNIRVRFPDSDSHDNANLRQHYLPIHPAPPHPDTGALLHLEGLPFLRRNSYIGTRGQYTVPFGILRTYDRSHETKHRYALARYSYQQLIKQAGFENTSLPPSAGTASCSNGSIPAIRSGLSAPATSIPGLTRPLYHAPEVRLPPSPPPALWRTPQQSTYGTIPVPRQLPHHDYDPPAAAPGNFDSHGGWTAALCISILIFGALIVSLCVRLA